MQKSYIDEVVDNFTKEGIKTDSLIITIAMWALAPPIGLKKKELKERTAPEIFELRDYNLNCDEKYAIWSFYKDLHNIESQKFIKLGLSEIKFDPPNWEKLVEYLIEGAKVHHKTNKDYSIKSYK